MTKLLPVAAEGEIKISSAGHFSGDLFPGTEMKRPLVHFETAKFILKRLHRAHLP